MRVAVLDDYQKIAHTFADWSSLEAEAVEFFHDTITDESALAERLAPFEVICIMRERTPFKRSLIEKLPKLKLLVTTGLRNASVDGKALAERGIAFCGTPSGGGPVELTWALILGLARGIAREDRALREGKWQTSIGIEMTGRTLGVLGLGKLGEGVAKLGSAFGMNVIAWSQNLTAERAAACGATLVTKDELFSRSDVVTIHLVLSDRSRGLVGAADLAKMKPGAYLINTSRGPIVDNPALLAALEKGAISAGLDVYAVEPLPPDDPIFKAPNTLLAPHVGYVTAENYSRMYKGTVEDILAWKSGSPLRTIS